ncbi:helicase HerA-like domain-containing protein [Roseicitreum antarcticum]|uniref:Helicase HerA-like C-terminal domain-containing protein n=1 Tax=Roseicitreum antarcticum TaxID=564137 RepID=A0A1H2U237_9RHOB|nr:helicase HerA-like domain-containing protein [Roseicitreum antarcticum]SDW49998.1 hypothetical protein SAMN04488238_102249 [Roseicitreum antarcticum]
MTQNNGISISDTATAGIFIGGGGADQAQAQHLLLRYGNRHGLIAGATGTGKTITMQIMAEAFSDAGVPVFLTDIKGDCAGMSQPGTPREAFARRAAAIGFNGPDYRALPVTFWDMFGENGHPVRATLAEMGPLLLSRMLEATEAQEGVLNVAFRIADDEGLPLLDLKDLQALLAFLGAHQREISQRYGTVTTASIGAIQRRLLILENQGVAHFFGEPALDLADILRVGADGRGQVNILHAVRLMQTPRLYATFLLWLLAELFETLPEVGDGDRPKLVFFFDEAHLLFNGAPRALIDKVEQVARLIRSKGVGIYFVTQNPDDVPETVLGQLGNRVQHALRAFTARDQQSLRRAAQTYRPNPRFDIADTIRDVGTGEALTSFLQDKGVPGIAERTLIRPPGSAMGPIEDSLRTAVMATSPVVGKYDNAVDRDSAHEMLARRAEAAAKAAEAADGSARAAGPGPWSATPAPDREDREFSSARRYQPTMPKTREPAKINRPTPARTPPTRRTDSAVDAFTKSFARQLGTKSGQALVRGILGGLFRGR